MKINELKEIAALLEKDLDLPSDFLVNLKKNDDWSFIIKVHALMEASISHLLVSHFGDKRLSNVFEFLELSDKRKGKMAFVKELDLLPKECRRFISTLSEIRNKLVHNVKNTNFSLKTYVENLNKQQFEIFFTSVESIDIGEGPLKPEEIKSKRFVSIISKELIYRYTIIIMAIIYLRKEIKELKELERKFSDELFANYKK